MGYKTILVLILSRAADHGADLLVMGIYGHSRVREMVLGGASRSLLGSMTVPVPMGHLAARKICSHGPAALH